MTECEKISIIVPCYNIAPYIETCVLSILQQTYTNIEVMLVDDGSTDGTAEILDSLAMQDERIRVIHQQNSGVTNARFAGLKAANGDWIGFVDGDDIIDPDMYERLLHNAYEHNAQISHCGYQMVFPSRVDYYYNTGHLVKQDRRSGLNDLIDGSRIEPGLWNKLFHKSLLQNLFQSRLMDFSIRNNEDLLMNYYLFRLAESTVYEDFCPYHYMVRKGSTMTSGIDEHKLRDPLLVLKKIKAETTDDSLLQKTVNSRIAGVLIGQATMRLDDQADLVRPIRDDARKELKGLVPELLYGDYSTRTKLLSIWATFWPWSYSVVHAIYARMRGIDKKYEVS